MVPLLLTLSLILTNFPVSQRTPPAKPLRAVYLKDVDGDGKADKLVYQIKPWKNDYEGSLVITSAKGKTLWEDGWLMVKDDLEELIETEGAVTGKKVDVKSWVDKFLRGDLHYGLNHESRKLKASELQDREILAVFAKYYHITPANLRENILSQKTNSLLAYRAEWREDLMLLVYVPSLGKFVCYQRGYD